MVKKQMIKADIQFLSVQMELESLLVLSGMGLHLGMDVEDWPPDNIEDLAKRLEDNF